MPQHALSLHGYGRPCFRMVAPAGCAMDYRGNRILIIPVGMRHRPCERRNYSDLLGIAQPRVGAPPDLRPWRSLAPTTGSCAAERKRQGTGHALVLRPVGCIFFARSDPSSAAGYPPGRVVWASAGAKPRHGPSAHRGAAGSPRPTGQKKNRAVTWPDNPGPSPPLCYDYPSHHMTRRRLG